MPLTFPTCTNSEKWFASETRRLPIEWLEIDWSHIMSDRLLSTRAVLDRICISRTVLYRKIKNGEFPKPVAIGQQRIAFLEAEVADWIAARVKAREVTAPTHVALVP
jgi:prophage regulatory protein